MGSLIKTGEVVEVDPRDIIYLYRFIREGITWNLDDYLNFLDKVGKKNSKYYIVNLPLNLLLIPKFAYSSMYESIKSIKVKRADKIKYENFSCFNVYRFEPNSDGKILKIELALAVGPNNNKTVARIWELGLILSESGFQCSTGNVNTTVSSTEYYHSTTRIYEGKGDIEDLQGYLRTLRWTQGKSYLELSKHSIPNEKGVVYKITHFEEKFFLFVNFLYTLYTGSFEKNDPGHILFEPFTELLRTYGNTFEEVLSTIKEVVTLVG
jgi:hypothetical protein